EIFNYAKKKGFALPAVNVTSSSTINAAMETAAKLNSPIIIQFSNGGGCFMAGKGLSNDNQQAAIAGSIAGAKQVHELAELYVAMVILLTEYGANYLLASLDGLLHNSVKYFEQNGKPFFSYHMIHLSEDHLEENIVISN